MNGLMTFGMHHAWRRAAARETIPSPDGTGPGPGDGHGRSRARAGPRSTRTATIVGADFAHGMLTVAEEKRRGRGGAGRIRLVEADALGLPFEARTFAFVTSAFLLRNLADLGKGSRRCVASRAPAPASSRSRSRRPTCPAGRRSSAPISTTWCRAWARSWAATARPTPICRSRWSASSRRAGSPRSWRRRPPRRQVPPPRLRHRHHPHRHRVRWRAEARQAAGSPRSSFRSRGKARRPGFRRCSYASRAARSGATGATRSIRGIRRLRRELDLEALMAGGGTRAAGSWSPAASPSSLPRSSRS